MKRIVASLIAGITLGSVGVAGATSFWGGNGVLCAKRNGIIDCMKSDSTGYQIGISRTQIMVTNNGGTHIVFHRYQP